MVGVTSTPDEYGYWLALAGGGVRAAGDAHLYGSMAKVHLNSPIVGIASTPDGQGYWLVAKDGGVFSFGDAVFYGSTGGIPLNKPVVGMAQNALGGYWLDASDGGIISFDAAFRATLGSNELNAPVFTTPACWPSYA